MLILLLLLSQAFWDSLADDLRLARPCCERVFRVLAEIRDGVSDLAGCRQSEAIGNAIDIDFIRSQVDSATFDWGSCKRLIGSVVCIIQSTPAPKRDTETQGRWVTVADGMLGVNVDQPRILCKALEFLLDPDRVNVMRIDSANAR